MSKPFWQLTLHGNYGCAIFDEAGVFVRRPMDQEAVGMLLIECLQTLRKHKILMRPTHPIKVKRAEEMDVGPEVELDVVVPEPTEEDL